MTDTSTVAGTPVLPPESSSELRTFLFADVRGYTRFTQEQGDEAAARLVVKFAGLLREGIKARGGRLLELRGDEALVVFTSARQALRAAVDLQTRFARETEADPSLPLPIGMGIDAGEAVPVEDGYRGEALNLAARLCNLAGPGEVLASEGVVYLGRRVQGVSYADRGLMDIKGFADRVRVVQVMRESEVILPNLQGRGNGASRAEAPPPIGGFLGALPSGALVGRAREWDRILSLLDDVAQGSGRLVLLSGEPGIGKTRLAQEVTLKARHWGFLVVTGRCYEQEQTVPYYPFLEALVTMYETAPSEIRAEIPRRWPHLGRLLPDQVGILPVVSVEGQEDQQRLFRAVTGILAAISETMPVAILLDDLHWADDSSLKLLQHLARYTHGHRVLLFGTYRDVDVHRQHPLEAALLDLGREQLVEEIEVRRLDLEGTKALMAEFIGDKEDLTDLIALVHRRTEGNAFFIQEVMRELMERGDVYHKDGRWERRKIHDMEVPKSVRSVIGQRLGRLEERAQEVLREASVLGHEFSFDDLMALGRLAPRAPDRMADSQPGASTGWTEDEVETALEQARAAGLVREIGDDEYTFNHALTQQALYAELSSRRRKRLHLAAGRALALLPEGTRERRAAELAWHFLEGDDAEQALPYAMLAGDQAEAVFAHGEAERQYRTGLELARELDREACEIEALEKLGAVLALMGRYDRALEMLEEAVRHHHAADDREGEACAVAQIGNIHFQRETPEEGIARLKPLVESLDGGAPSYGLAALWAALARLYDAIDEYKEQLRAADRAMELAREIGDTKLLIGAEVTRSSALSQMGQHDDALRVVEELIPRAEEAGDLTNLARALGNAARYYARRGEFDKDRLYRERALEVAERRGDRHGIIMGSMSLNMNAFLTGDWDLSRRHLERAEGIIRSLGATNLSLWPVMARGWLALREGDMDAVETYAQEALSITGEDGDSDWWRLTLRLLAEHDLLDGRPEDALNRLEPVRRYSGWKKDSGILWTLAWIHLELGNESEAQDLAARAIARARARSNQSDLVEALNVQGRAMAKQGSWNAAELLFDEALALARSLPLPFGEARVLYEYGAMQAVQGSTGQARRRLKKALSVFQRLGAIKDAERVERALADLGRP